MTPIQRTKNHYFPSEECVFQPIRLFIQPRSRQSMSQILCSAECCFFVPVLPVTELAES
ncbi:hypothetical protein ASPZODRAFT_128867 [Penicilliopsis zonata CBS 506.65]|uniref:Uncharacterized protein n=1 Tax=Penicilliopsis zonata CBS 506.65 TaxID=1073090 RepID=A0A1L9SSQ2_9EURO|nr:hypothetical protein ASPZODRAFT_128867 [Penicilliopsis zonata CBS 506.65]OJJ50240.1 hypothetical protein ASPZODRAFT_128867 [Penicilliopsis zonata CBS 506.65]